MQHQALILYWSATGNTEKVARSIEQGLSAGGYSTRLQRVADAAEEDFYAYDLVCFGAPSYNWRLPKPADDYLQGKFKQYKAAGRVVPGAPALPGKHALVFCTYSGPHTGMREAVPAGKCIGQYFEHFGFTVADEWYILSEFIGSEENSIQGRMGDIRGLPSREDLRRIESAARNLAERLLPRQS